MQTIFRRRLPFVFFPSFSTACYLPYSVARTKILGFWCVRSPPRIYVFLLHWHFMRFAEKTVMDSNLYVESNEIISASATTEPSRQGPWHGNVRK